ncbi:SRPBCC family protein [uncultured Thiohalocapsa sp.]|uniref:SRPBCC family protein n=1 Tax=uncultured Thiohalocapsa sp. TaxID=768990 RepID=UPI0025DC1FD7|nr:SRPBCC family protein [uncultured Thiohalocapsa sp.]
MRHESMHHVSAVIPAPAEAAWHILIDTEEWPRWGPSVRAVRSPQRCIGPDTTGHIQTPLGAWLPFRITHWQPGRSWTWRVAGIAATGHEVIPLGTTRCRVSFLIPRWAPLYRPVCETALRRIAERATAL